MGSCGVDIVSGVPVGATQNLQQVCDVGNVTTTPMAVAGGVLASAAAGIDEFVLGNLAVDNQGMSIQTARYARYGSTNTAGASEMGIMLDNAGLSVSLINGATLYYIFSAALMSPRFTSQKDLGADAVRWKFGFINQFAGAVASVGDASYAVPVTGIHYITIVVPAAGINTITLLPAVIGMTLFVDITAGAAGAVNLATTGGDTFNGGAASPLALGNAKSLWIAVADTVNNWNVHLIG